MIWPVGAGSTCDGCLGSRSLLQRLIVARTLKFRIIVDDIIGNCAPGLWMGPGMGANRWVGVQHVEPEHVCAFCSLTDRWDCQVARSLQLIYVCDILYGVSRI